MNRYGFVLYGLNAKEFKNIEKLILEGIRQCFKDLRIDDAIIEKYLCDAGIYSNIERVNENNIRLSDYINKGYSIIYQYDFGDGWNH